MSHFFLFIINFNYNTSQKTKTINKQNDSVLIHFCEIKTFDRMTGSLNEGNDNRKIKIL